MWQIAEVRTQTRQLLNDRGPAAFLQQSDAVSAAIRQGHDKAADRGGPMPVQAEQEVDGRPLPSSPLAFRRSAAAAESPSWRIS